MRLREFAPAIWVLALSAVVLIGTWESSYWSGTTPGPAFLPWWLAGAGLVVAGLALAEALYRKEGEGEMPAWPDGWALARAMLTFAGLLAVPILMPFIGLVVSGALFMAFLLLVVMRRPLLASLATVAITGGVVQAVFVWWLGLPLPVGTIWL